MPKREALKQEPSTGNVFADLGLADAGEHLIKAGLVVRIDRTIRQRKLTQAAAAQLMGIDQPKISAMLAGQFRAMTFTRAISQPSTSATTCAVMVSEPCPISEAPV